VATLTAHSWQFIQNLDGTFDGDFPLGTKTPTLTWNISGLASLVNQPANVAISFNARAMLSGTGASTATITLVAQSGDTPSTKGWVDPAGGNNATNPATISGGGVLVLRATFLGINTDSPAIPWNILAVSSGTGVKFHAGCYLWFSSYTWNVANNPPPPQTPAAGSLFAFIDSIGADPNIAGIQFTPWMHYFEGNTQGDYTPGFAMVDAILAKLAACPTKKRLLIGVNDRTFSNPTGVVPNNVYPQYLVSQGLVVVAPAGSTWSGNLSSVLNFGDSRVWDALINLTNAFGARYDTHPLVEMFYPMGETAVAPQAGVTGSGFITGINRLYPTTKPSWPHTMLRLEANYSPNNDQQFVTLFTACRSAGGIAIGGPDPESPLPLTGGYPTGFRTIQANLVYRGLSIVNGQTVASYTDLRGKMPWIGEYQLSSGSVGAGAILPGDFWTYQTATMNGWHLVFPNNTFLPANTSSSDPHKTAAIITLIDSKSGATLAGVPSEGTWNTAP
jgi:hypothetical protein